MTDVSGANGSIGLQSIFNGALLVIVGLGGVIWRMLQGQITSIKTVSEKADLDLKVASELANANLRREMVEKLQALDERAEERRQTQREQHLDNQGELKDMKSLLQTLVTKIGTLPDRDEVTRMIGHMQKNGS